MQQESSFSFEKLAEVLFYYLSNVESIVVPVGIVNE